MRRRLLVTLFLAFTIIFFRAISVEAQERTTIITAIDKSEVKIGEEFRVYIKAENVYDLYGVQFTINYDTQLLDLVSSTLDMKNGFKSFGGETVDKSKGVITYPLINSNSKKELLKEQLIGELVFKGKSKGGNILNASNIKAVDSDAVVISKNTDYSIPINVVSSEVVSVTPAKPQTENDNIKSGDGQNTSDDKEESKGETDKEDTGSDKEQVANKEEKSNVSGSKEENGTLKNNAKVEKGQAINGESKGIKEYIPLILASVAAIIIAIGYKTKAINKIKDKLKTKKDRG
ncbi:cohesin domain-containing protein [Clostridium sp. 'White wine YQ']|uniref:cohesin domain-containing protein n=1 Tax=Clostridium sp. 'White wine YQ' TaxID=3027474 RepID=UPI002365C662|nr:cohesin domain-containing protein [Clostridium sp. 'White wine YQ']MDD7795008.1 cohesin domain-containing protein [Clostridium sp. 'White wine YQ']